MIKKSRAIRRPKGLVKNGRNAISFSGFQCLSRHLGSSVTLPSPGHGVVLCYSVELEHIILTSHFFVRSIFKDGRARGMNGGDSLGTSRPSLRSFDYVT